MASFLKKIGKAIGSPLGSILGSAGKGFLFGGGPMGALAGGLGGLANFLTKRNSRKMGSGLGALAGGLGGLGDFGGFFGGTDEQTTRIPRFTEEQEGALSQLLSQGLGNMDLGALEEQAQQRFQQDIVPSLAERFTALGGGQRSSAFQGALGRAGAGLAGQMAVMRPQFGLQQLQMGLQPQFDSIYSPPEMGFGQRVGIGFGGSIGSLLPLLGQLLSSGQGGM